MKTGLIIKRNSKKLIFWCVLFIALIGVSYPALFYPPHSDYWAEMFYVFHNLDSYPGSIKWLHVLNIDPFEQMRYQPLSHLFYYIEQLLFGSNFTLFNIINFLFYFLSIFLFYKFALYFFKNKKLILFLIVFFSVLFNHFDIVLWSCHMYIIIGFCMFLLGFILYLKFLKTGRLLFVNYVIAFFLLGMWCYESFFFWPFAIIIISSIRSFKSNNLPKKNIIVVNIIILIVIYIFYILVYFFTRSLGTYDAPAHHLSDFFTLPHVILSIFSVFFNFVYNGSVINMYPLLSFPLKVAENISLGGPIIEKISKNHMIIFIGGGFAFAVLTGFLIHLYKKFPRDYFKMVSLFIFLMLSETYIPFFCRLVTNNSIYSYVEFSYQYVPNAYVILLILFLIEKYLKLSRKKIKIVTSIFSISLVLNIYCIRKTIDIYSYHYINLNKMIKNIKLNIKKGLINEENKIYLDDDIPDYLPGLCWNIEMGERFMEGNYQWMFSKKEIKYFSNGYEEAKWVIDKENFTVIPKSLKSTSQKAKKINRIENASYVDIGKDWTYNNLGYMFENQGNYKKAEEMYKKAIEFTPENDRAYVELGHFYNRHKKYKKAEEVFLKAREINPNNDSIYDGLGGCYSGLGRYQEAEKMLKKAVELNPDNDVMYMDLGFLYNSQKKYSKAEKMFKKAMSINPDNIELYRNLEELYTKEGRIEEAERMFEKAEKMQEE